MRQDYPLIVPVPVEHRRDCIVQDGVRYCEDQPVSSAAIGWVLLISALAITWIATGMWLQIEKDIWWAMPVAILGPLVVGGLYFVLRSS